MDHKRGDDLAFRLSAFYAASLLLAVSVCIALAVFTVLGFFDLSPWDEFNDGSLLPRILLPVFVVLAAFNYSRMFLRLVVTVKTTSTGK